MKTHRRRLYHLEQAGQRVRFKRIVRKVMEVINIIAVMFHLPELLNRFGINIVAAVEQFIQRLLYLIGQQ